MPGKREVYLYRCECGGKPYIEEVYNNSRDHKKVRIECENYSCEKYTKYYKNERGALKAWNEGRYAKG